MLCLEPAAVLNPLAYGADTCVSSSQGTKLHSQGNANYDMTAIYLQPG